VGLLQNIEEDYIGGYEMNKIKICLDIQKLLNNIKLELLNNNITEIAPVVILLSNFNIDLIKKFAKKNNVEYKKLFGDWENDI
jgi:hypothetical protein